MTIRKGHDWGELGSVPAGAREVTTNRELYALLNGPRPWPVVRLRGGDLARTLGRSSNGDDRTPAQSVLIAPVDVMVVTLDSGRRVAAAHVVARRGWWRGPIVAVANAQFLGRWDLAPRGHPNDGWLDVTEVGRSMAVRQRFLAWRRLPTARHLPHPDLATRRVHQGEWTFPRALDAYLDGVRVGPTRSLAVSVEPDALTVCL